MARTREFFAGVLTLCVMTAPAWGATAGALGTVVASEHANISGTGAAVGTTIFAGDSLTTEDAGSVQLRTGAARFQLSAASAATLSEDGAMPRATLLRGTGTFSAANSQAFALLAETAVIRPKSDQPTIGQVSILGAKQILVKCLKGTLTITVGNDSQEVPEGKAYKVMLDSAADEAQSQPPAMGSGSKGSGRAPIAAAKSRFVYWVGGGVTLLTIFAVQEALESPDRP
ncbi:MAG TPA: hypothetical protein VJN93_08180 [Candidatus Acidoferrum sp.]|nr:hypothetical protein [Candidatus Acidoferrum sp.]